MSDDDPGYLPIKPGDRVVIEFDDPEDTRMFGGPGIVVSVENKWTAKIDKGDGVAWLYGRWLLRAPD